MFCFNSFFSPLYSVLYVFKSDFLSPALTKTSLPIYYRNLKIQLLLSPLFSYFISVIFYVESTPTQLISFSLLEFNNYHTILKVDNNSYLINTQFSILLSYEQTSSSIFQENAPYQFVFH